MFKVWVNKHHSVTIGLPAYHPPPCLPSYLVCGWSLIIVFACVMKLTLVMKRHLYVVFLIKQLKLQPRECECKYMWLLFTFSFSYYIRYGRWKRRVFLKKQRLIFVVYIDWRQKKNWTGDWLFALGARAHLLETSIIALQYSYWHIW